MPGGHIHDEVLRILRGSSPGRMLDIPSGSSPIAAAARGLGYRVVGVDLFPPPGSRDVVRADACGRLPFADASFDVVVTMEGIEHFENQAAFVRECARVLVPGGLLVLTTPNLLHLSARLSVFLTGQRQLKRGFVNEDETLRGRDGERVHHGHAFLIDAVRLRYLLALSGFGDLELHRGRLSSTSVLLAPLVPVLWGATRLSLRLGRATRRREGKGRPLARPGTLAELRRLADSPTLLFSRSLIATARKRTEPGREAADAGASGRRLPQARGARVSAGS